MKANFPLVVVLALLVAGCKTSTTAINKVHLGMSEPDVVKILGAPDSRAENKDGSARLFYTLRTGGSIYSPYSVTLRAGKVDAYGRDPGPAVSSIPFVPAPAISQ